MNTYYICKDGDQLDWVCWKHYGQQSGAVEAILVANPHLASHGHRFKAGTKILLPTISSNANQTIRLWD